MVALSVAALPRDAGSDEPVPAVWVLHDGKAGMASQALGLAEAAGYPFREMPLAIARPWRWLPPQLWLMPQRAASTAGIPLAPPWPDLVIACGRNAAMPALAIRRAGGGRSLAVQIQDPRVGRGEFDLIFVPEHDRWRGPQAIVTRAALHRVTPALLAAERRRFPQLETLKRPVLGVLVGGANRSYRASLSRFGEIAEAIAAALRRSGGSLVLTPSRRTGAAALALLRDRLADFPAAIWDGQGDNPYFAYLAIADALIVTADSVSMVSEAAATGKPVHILDLDGGDAKFARFHRAMRAAGITRPFAGRIESWTYQPPDDTARAGAMVRRLVESRLQRRDPA